MGFWLVDAVIIFVPSLTYIDQYRKIYTTRHLGSFNPWICVILILSMLLRCFFWVERAFDNALLYQAFLLIATQLFVFELCLRVLSQRYKEIDHELDSPGALVQPSILTQVHFFHCVSFLFVLALVLKLMHMLVSPSAWYTELLGSAALGLEATVPMPQCYANYKNKSTAGVSLLLILSWFIGDFTKIIYYLYIQSPLQFVVCGVLQLSVDLIIFAQMRIYHQSRTSVYLSPSRFRAHSF